MLLVWGCYVGHAFYEALSVPSTASVSLQLVIGFISILVFVFNFELSDLFFPCKTVSFSAVYIGICIQVVLFPELFLHMSRKCFNRLLPCFVVSIVVVPDDVLFSVYLYYDIGLYLGSLGLLQCCHIGWHSSIADFIVTVKSVL